MASRTKKTHDIQQLLLLLLLLDLLLPRPADENPTDGPLAPWGLNEPAICSTLYVAFFFFFFLNIRFWFRNLCLITTCFYHTVGTNAIVVCLAGIKQVNPEKLQFFRAVCLCVWVCGCAQPARAVQQTANNQQNLQPASGLMVGPGSLISRSSSQLWNSVDLLSSSPPLSLCQAC